MGTSTAVLADDEHDGRMRCGGCGELVDVDDRGAVCAPDGVHGAIEWYCSTECFRRARRREAGREVEPYYGEQLERGFRMLYASENRDW